MKYISLLLINLTFIFASCQTKTDSSKLKENSDCVIFYKKYKEATVSQQIDSALNYIDKAIKCDPNNASFKSNKIRFLISINKYKDAIEVVNTYSSKDTSLKMLEAVLKLKLETSDSKDLLQRCYDEYKQDKQMTNDKLVYKIALTNYFKNKDEALKEIEYSKKKSSEEYERTNLEALEELIKKHDKREVLFNLFGIGQN